VPGVTGLGCKITLHYARNARNALATVAFMGNREN